MRAPSVAPREWAVVLTGALTLAFTAWGLAGVQLWSLHTLLAGGLLTLLFSIAPALMESMEIEKTCIACCVSLSFGWG